MAAWRATAPMTLGEPASSRSGGSVQATSSRSTRSTAPPPARNGSPSAKLARGPISTPAPNGAYILWPLHATKSAAAGSGRWGASWAASTSTGIDRAWAAAMTASSGGDQPVTFDAPVTASNDGVGRRVEDGDDVVDVERSVRAAFDEAASTQPGPGQQVGVMLDHGGDDHVVRLRAGAGRPGG